MSKRQLGVWHCLVLMGSVGVASAGDWPTWRHDAARTAVTSEALAPDLSLLWSRQLRAPRPAWPASQSKLQFDASYEPVVSGKLLFVPSMTSDRISAYETDTGLESWRWYADGPIRFAPLVHEGSLYVVSDDGLLYCLKARTGQPRWKFRPGPDARCVIGNDRLVGMWPVRGAPVLAAGRIYVAAGIWPFMGTFLQALDASTGRVVWTNSGSGSIYVDQPHFSPAFAGVAPQGYLAVARDVLVVPGGRSVPAGYDLETGEFRFFDPASRQFGKKAGGYRVSAAGDWFVNGGCLYDASDGAGVTDVGAGVYANGTFYTLRDGMLTALGGPLLASPGRNRRGKKATGRALSVLWQAELDPSPEQLLLMAGDRLYGCRAGGTVMAVDGLAGAKPQLSWQARVDGTPWSMVAADGKLFVVTSAGGLFCFGDGQRQAVQHTLRHEPLPGVSAAWRRHAELLKAETGVREGHALVLGIGSGQLMCALLQGTELQLIVVERDADRVRHWRERLDTADLYGTRVSIVTGDPLSVPFPPYVARLITSERPDLAARVAQDDVLGRLYGWLRPYGGVACFAVAAAQHAEFAARVAAAGLAGARTSHADGWSFVRRLGPLPGAGSWTHQYADAGNTVVSADALTKAPLGLLWFGGPPNDPVLPRHGHGPSPQVVGGRLFIEGRDMLRAVDVYTGRLLWERSLPGIGTFYDNTAHQPGANEIGGNYVSVADGIYVMHPDACLRLDPATGATQARFTLPSGAGKAPPRWGTIRVWQDWLVATASPVDVPLEDVTVRLIDRHADWRYLAGVAPPAEWDEAGFDDSTWALGKAGFGYGDDDDNTVLGDMHKHYTTVCVRRVFEVADPDAFEKVMLAVRYDDGFVAFLNGTEVLRQGVSAVSGGNKVKVASHEAGSKYDTFALSGEALLRSGRNVLALEGHNSSTGSSDFTLDPFLVSIEKEGRSGTAERDVDLESVPDVVANAEYASASRSLVVMDRHTGAPVWSRPAAHSFRHNSIALGAGKVFCIDGMSAKKFTQLRRRGYVPATTPVLYALDAPSGRVLWRSEEDVFGTWLGYSAEHDVLLQAGSRARDRARDEVGAGMVAYRGADGTLLWKHLRLEYTGPPLLRHGTVFTQGAAYSLLTGEPVLRQHPLTGEQVAWRLSRNYGCNTIIGSEHLLTFRSAAAGFRDLNDVDGTANLGGFKSGCTSNLVVADGVLNAPDYTRTCICAYQNQASLAFVHMPDVEVWTFSSLPAPSARIRQVGINLGAPGDRTAPNGTLWLDYPSVGGPSPDPGIELTGAAPTWFRRHSSGVEGSVLPWVVASGVKGVRDIRIKLVPDGGAAASAAERAYTVRLYFAEPDALAAGQRVIDVWLQGKRVLERFAVAPAADGRLRGVVREFKGVAVSDVLRLGLTPAQGSEAGPALCGIEVVGEWGAAGM